MDTVENSDLQSNQNISPKQSIRTDSYFDGNTWQLIGYRILSALVTTITLGIAYPWMLCMVQRWETKHTVIDGRRLKFNGNGVQLIGKWILWVFLTIVTLGIYGIWLGLGMKKWVVKHTVYADDGQPVDSYFSGGAGGFLGIHLLSFVLTVFTLGIGKAWADKTVLCWEAKHTHIGGSPLEFNGTGGQLFVKYLLLVLLTPLTLGIYALFFPVIYLKWQIQNTMAVYQKPEIQAEARSHELAAVQDYAKYRIAANDTEIAMLRSGYTGKEDPDSLERMAEDGNPFAAYHLAKLLKGENALYEGRALALLQKAADGNYDPAQFDLAQQLPKEQAIPMLENAARNGSSAAPWLLANHYKQNGSLKEAAYWFKVALEWGDRNALAQRDQYDHIIQNIALRLSEAQLKPKTSSTLPIVLGVAGGVLLIVFGVMALLGLRFFGGRVTVNSITPSEKVDGGHHVQDVTLMQARSIDDIRGEEHDALDYHGNTIHYILDKSIFFDYEEKMLYFEFGVIEYDFPICLTDKAGWKTEEITESGIFRVPYPYDAPPERIAVSGQTFITSDKYDIVNILSGTTAEAEKYLEEKTKRNDPEESTPENTEAPTDAETIEAPTEPVTPEANIAENIVGKWVCYDPYADPDTGEDTLEILTYTFNSDGTYDYVWEKFIVSTEGSTYYDGKYWTVADGLGQDGTYHVSGNNLSVRRRFSGEEPTYSTIDYTIELHENILSIYGDSGETRDFERK